MREPNGGVIPDERERFVELFKKVYLNQCGVPRASPWAASLGRWCYRYR